MPYYRVTFELDEILCEIVKWAKTVKEAIEFVMKYYPEADIKAVIEKD